MRIDSTQDYSDLDGETWTDQETFLLLEAIELYNENWNEIAEHVGTKSKAQCILHFVRLPVEDGLLEKIEVPNVSKLSNQSSRDDLSRLHSTSNGDLPGTLNCCNFHHFNSLLMIKAFCDTLWRHFVLSVQNLACKKLIQKASCHL